MADRVIVIISSDSEDELPNRHDREQLCSRHQHQHDQDQLLKPRASTSTSSSKPIVISSDSCDSDPTSDVEVIGQVNVSTYKVPAHTCSRVQSPEAQITSSHSPATTPRKSLLVHTCSQHQRVPPSVSRHQHIPPPLVSKNQDVPQCTVRPQPRSSLKVDHSVLSTASPSSIKQSPSATWRAKDNITRPSSLTKQPLVTSPSNIRQSPTSTRRVNDDITRPPSRLTKQSQVTSNIRQSPTTTQRVNDDITRPPGSLTKHPLVASPSNFRQSPTSTQRVNDDITSPSSSQKGSPTKRLLSVKRRNRLHASLVNKRPSSSSSDSDGEYEKSPNRGKRKKRGQKENRQVYPGTMYLEKDTVANMPVSNLNTEDNLPVADLPCYPIDDAPIHRLQTNSTFVGQNENQGKKRRNESDSDNEVAMLYESRKDVSSPIEVQVYQDLGRRAFQENQQMRNDSGSYRASPHRSPLQARQDQVISPRSSGFQRRTELVYSPSKRQKLSKPLKSHDTEPPMLALFASSIDRVQTPPIDEPPVLLPSTDSEELAPVRWTPKKLKQDERRHQRLSAFDVIKELSNSDSWSDFERSSVVPKRAIVSSHSKVDHMVKPLASRVAQQTPVITTPVPSEPPGIEHNKKLYVAGVPVHVKPKCTSSEACNSDEEPNENNDQLCFGIFIQTLLEGCEEEGHHNDAIDFIHSFTNKRRCPSNQRLDYILQDILMTNADNAALLVNAFRTLKHIQNLHPRSKYVQWKTVCQIMKVLVEDGANETLIKLHSNLLGLKYITSILEEDLETQSEDGYVNRSYVYNMLSPDTRIANVRTVIAWVCKCIERIHQEECNNVSPQPKLKQPQGCRKNLLFGRAEAAQSVQDPPESRLTILLMVLKLLQKLLYMCMVASVNLDQNAAKVADEFLYFYSRLPSYEHKRKVLQSITCHQLRIKLIELILDDYATDEDTVNMRVLALSIAKIVEYYFKCIPSKDVDNNDDDDSDDEGEDVKVKESTQDPACDCEELVMLLLYLMQSYIWSTNGKVPETDRTLRMRSANESQHRSSSHAANQLMPFHGKFTMSMNDREPLIMMGDYVEDLRRRLLRRCMNLTFRTKLYLNQLEAMRDIADCD